MPSQKTAVLASSRERIREGAKALFAERGFEATTTAAICRLAGTSQSQLIKHFTDKQGILEAVFEHTWEQINPAVQLATESIVAARDKLKILTDMILGEELIRFAWSKIWPLGRLRHHNLSDDCRAGGDSCLDHNQSQKGLHCVGADAHPIRNLFAAQAVHQITQRFSLALREI